MGDFDSACFRGCVHASKSEDSDICKDCKLDNNFKNYKMKKVI